MKPDESGERIITDGLEKPYHRRRPVSLETNGTLKHMRLSVNIPVVGSIVAFLALLFGSVYTLSTYIFEPRLEKVIGIAIDEKMHGLHSEMIELKASLELTRSEQSKLRAQMMMTGQSRWTLIDERIQTERIRALNPKLIIPDPIHQPLPGEDQ